MRIIEIQNLKVWTVLLSAFYCLLPAVNAVPISCLSDMWFGPDCRFKCNCQDGTPCAGRTGLCTFGCLHGWFGPSCQYRIANVSFPAWATDDNPETCQSSISEPIMGKLLFPMPLSWLQLGSTFSVDFGLVTVEYSLDGDVELKTCPTNHVRPVQDQTYYFTREIFCPVDDDVTKIVIKNNGTKPLCAIDVSLGRNMAVKQSIFFDSPATDKTIANRLISTELYHCIPVMEFPLSAKLYLLFNRPRDITFFQIELLVVKDCCESIGDPFGVVVYTTDYTTLRLGPAHYFNSSSSIQLVFVPPKGKSITMVAFNKLEESSGLFFCKIEAFGDCPRGTYGARCEAKCNCKNNSRCSPTGLCSKTCPPGFKGRNCSEGCLQSKYGPDCHLACSPFCINQICDPVDGVCLGGCKDSFQAPDCRHLAKSKSDEDEEERRISIDQLNELESLNKQLETSVFATSVSAGVLLIALVIFIIYTALPQRTGITDFELNGDFFLSYEDVKRNEIRRGSSWDSNIGVVGDMDFLSTSGTVIEQPPRMALTETIV